MQAKGVAPEILRDKALSLQHLNRIATLDEEGRKKKKKKGQFGGVNAPTRTVFSLVSRTPIFVLKPGKTTTNNDLGYRLLSYRTRLHKSRAKGPSKYRRALHWTTLAVLSEESWDVTKASGHYNIDRIGKSNIYEITWPSPCNWKPTRRVAYW